MPQALHGAGHFQVSLFVPLQVPLITIKQENNSVSKCVGFNVFLAFA